MRFKNLTLATAAVVGALGLAGVAAAAIHNSHVMTVELPDGATARIRYFGDTLTRASHLTEYPEVQKIIKLLQSMR